MKLFDRVKINIHQDDIDSIIKFIGYYILIDNIEYLRLSNGEWHERSRFGDKYDLCSILETQKLEERFVKYIRSTKKLDYLSM